MNRSRAASEELLRKVEQVGFDAIFLTVDAAVPGKRERDQRVKGDFTVSSFFFFLPDALLSAPVPLLG
jgi:isopentenyl diphosphate isomerase/L-lactate dehydrogenase-like FMN-dependent dehydrogenase